MLNGLRNFAINRVLRQVADNAKLNRYTNWVAVVLVAALTANANWVLILSYFSHPTPAGLQEVLRVAGVMIAALLLYLTGKFPWLQAWLPAVEDIVAEAEKQEEKKAS